MSSPTDASPLPSSSGYGPALAQRREALGYASQSALAVRSRSVANRLAPLDLRPISQQTLSRLEDDTDGALFRRARPETLRSLAYLLRWNAADFAEHVGVLIPPVPLLDGDHAEERIQGASLRRAREQLGLSWAQVQSKLARGSSVVPDLRELEELELGLLPLELLPDTVQSQLWRVLGRIPLEAPENEQTGLSAERTVVRPLYPLGSLLPGAAREALAAVTVATAALQDTTILVRAEDEAVQGVRPGDLYFVEPAVPGIRERQVYVVEVKAKPQVRRAIKDAQGTVWFTADGPEWTSQAPVRGADVAVLGWVRLVQPQPREP